MCVLCVFAEVYGELYAYQYRPASSTVHQRSGWLLYEALLEYERMGVPNHLWQATKLNNNYEVCSCVYIPFTDSLSLPLSLSLSLSLSPSLSLPPSLPLSLSSVIHTAAICLSQLVLTQQQSWAVQSSVAKVVFLFSPFTTHLNKSAPLLSPLPAACVYYTVCVCVCVCVCVFVVQSALCRSSQPLAGLLGRSSEDEEMIQCILKASPNTTTLHVMDTRPRVSYPSPSLSLSAHSVSSSDQCHGQQGSGEGLRGLWVLSKHRVPIL